MVFPEVVHKFIQPFKEVKVLINCPGGRFKAGDKGLLMENDFPKYDVKIALLDGRVFYFYKEEIEFDKAS